MPLWSTRLIYAHGSAFQVFKVKVAGRVRYNLSFDGRMLYTTQHWANILPLVKRLGLERLNAK